MDHLPDILLKHLSEIQMLCKKHHVARLWVFGSVLRNDFSEESDIDFLYEWDDQSISEEEYLTNLWSLLDQLEVLLGHKIDWIYYPNLRNPYFIAEIEENKVLLYDQKAEEIPV